MLSARELARIQTTVVGSFPSSGTVYANAGTTDPLGSVVDSFSAIGTVPCRIIPTRKSVEVEVGGEVRSVPGFNVYVPVSATVPAQHRLASNGQTYEFVGGDKGQSEPGCIMLTAVIVP